MNLLRTFKRHFMFIVGLTLVCGMSLAALCAPWLAPFDPNAQIGRAHV